MLKKNNLPKVDGMLYSIMEILGRREKSGKTKEPKYSKVGRILGTKVAKSVVDSIFRRHIVITPGVEAILSFESDFDGATRTYNASFKVRSKTGEELQLEFTGEI